MDIYDLLTNSEGSFIRKNGAIIKGPFANFGEAWDTMEELACTQQGKAIYRENPNYAPPLPGDPVISKVAWCVRK